ncbi:DUF2946 family protein [Azospirillum canadense]|uniref:DUF2946 family protein n=1 Tax=Azospirillum canadense TaxID=403962 RepID=UPI0038736D4D
MTRRLRPLPRWTATLAVVLATSLLLLLVQVPRQAVAMLAAGMAQVVAAEAMCVHEGGGESPPPTAPDARHDHAPCLACQVCCTAPATLLTADVAVPRPWRRYQLRAVPAKPLPRRRPRGRRPNARAPPGPPHAFASSST